MARITQRLTAIDVTNLKDKGLYPDGDGLYLRVTGAGTKSWIYRFTQDGSTRDMGLGPVPSMSLAKARQLAAEARRRHLDGEDPIAVRKAQRRAARLAAARGMPFKEAAEQLIASHEAGWRNAKHQQQWRNTLKTYAYPILGQVPVDAIDTDLVLKVLEPIWTKKPETAGRIRGRIEAVLNRAKALRSRGSEPRPMARTPRPNSTGSLQGAAHPASSGAALHRGAGTHGRAALPH